MKISVRDLMEESGVAFGTSGARGLATAMTDQVCYTYTRGFLQYLESTRESRQRARTPADRTECGPYPRETIGEKRPGAGTVAVAGDFRPSTGRIMEAVARAAEAMGARVINCGRIPSPAVALFGLEENLPAIMVTGSHIPDDRNGIKFNKASGEILKNDEKGMTEQLVDIDDTLFDEAGTFRSQAPQPREESGEALERYVKRYLEFFEADALRGARVGVYQHSAVGRDVLVSILSGLGAEAVALGRSDKFLPVDTEAIRPEDVQLARDYAKRGHFDAIVSADGDSDRPLVSDECGEWLRGDVAGIVCAKFLEADCVCTPVSCNTALEKTGWFREIRRTRIGSPYVIEAMQAATASGAKRVMGYEANGGFLTNSVVARGGRKLRALPTRDAVIVILSILISARRDGKRISQLVSELPRRFTASDRLKNFPTAKSAEILQRFTTGSVEMDREEIGKVFGSLSGEVANIDRTDGVRATFSNGEIIHLRPSGNAPEFRCYTEAGTDDRAKSLNAKVLRILRGL